MSREQKANMIDLSRLSGQELRSLRKRINAELKGRKPTKSLTIDTVYRPGGRVRRWTLYVLQLKNNKYYVGITAQKVQNRYEQHANGTGAKWTKLHQPLGILEYYSIGVMSEGEAVAIETNKTLEYISMHGSEHVRGGKLTIIDDKKLEKVYQRLLRVHQKSLL